MKELVFMRILALFHYNYCFKFTENTSLDFSNFKSSEVLFFMSRKVYIKKEICEHTLKTAAEEFYKHNRIP